MNLDSKRGKLVAQNDNGWILQVVLASPIIQAGIAVGATLAVSYVGKQAFNKMFGPPKDEDANERTRLALDALSKVVDAQAKLIELQQAEREGLLDETWSKIKTQPIPPDIGDME